MYVYKSTYFSEAPFADCPQNLKVVEIHCNKRTVNDKVVHRFSPGL